MRRPTKNYVDRAFRALKLQDNMLVLVKHGTYYSGHNELEHFVDGIKRTGLRGIVVAVVAGLDDVNALDEEEMAKHGWVKSEH